MGWAVTYRVRLGRKLTAEEESILGAWMQEHEALTPTGPNAVSLPDKHGIRRKPLGQDNAFLDEWRQLLPADAIARAEGFANAKRARLATPRRGDADADYSGFIQTRSTAKFCKVVRAFQKLEKLLPFADIRLSDDYYLKDARPSEAGDPWKLVKP
ncbi:hypothetical protein NR798_37840 [Archangium gephyra]|uniref:hypothetical protein n=1 Tax=Archangium gephyra TaxID=48 RepID=UPI0035D526EF